MPKKTKPKPSKNAVFPKSVIADAIPAINEGMQIVYDLYAILAAISKYADEETARLARMGVQIIEGDRMEKFTDAYDELRTQLRDLSRSDQSELT